MLEDAIEKYNIDREKSYMIGDKASDIGAGLKSKLKTILSSAISVLSAITKLAPLSKNIFNIRVSIVYCEK